MECLVLTTSVGIQGERPPHSKPPFLTRLLVGVGVHDGEVVAEEEEVELVGEKVKASLVIHRDVVDDVVEVDIIELVIGLQEQAEL